MKQYFLRKATHTIPPKNEGDKTRSPGRTQPNRSTLRVKASIWRFLCCSFGRGCALGSLPSATEARPHRQLRTLPASQNVASRVTSGTSIDGDTHGANARFGASLNPSRVRVSQSPSGLKDN